MSIRFLLEEAFRSWFRSKRLNLISLGAMSMSLLALGLVLVLNVGLMRVTDFIEQKVEVVIFLTDEIKDDAIAGLVTKIQDHPEVTAAQYISKQDAFNEFARDAALQKLLSILGQNPLPASIRINLLDKTPENVQNFITWLKNLPGVGDVSYGGGDADRLLQALRFVRLAVLILTVSLVLASVVIVANIISLMVNVRQDEIRLMRSIGATNGFIRGPFLLWGVLQGALGGLLATAWLYLIWYLLCYYSLRDLGLDLNALLPATAAEEAMRGALGLMAAGCALGFVGSLISLGRHLSE